MTGILTFESSAAFSSCSTSTFTVKTPLISVLFAFESHNKAFHSPFDILLCIYRIVRKKHTVKQKNIPLGEYRTQGRIWIESEGGTFLGYGRVVLLERVQQHGSIAQAARSMEMSYKHAWDLIHSMNRQAREPLLLTSKGGKGGGGAQLTAAGERAVAQFWQFHKRFLDFLAGETANLKS